VKIIPIQDVAGQKFSIVLGGQDCTIELFVRSTGMYCNLYVADSLVIGGVICQNMNRIVRDSYLGFLGDLVFHDTQGNLDPTTPGLGTRYVFVYLEESDVF